MSKDKLSRRVHKTKDSGKTKVEGPDKYEITRSETKCLTPNDKQGISKESLSVATIPT